MLGTYTVILITVPTREEALKISRDLLEKKLIACINILDNVHSLYWWKGKIEEGKELLLVIKTRLDLFEKVLESVKRLHSYEVPEVIALPIIAGNRDYLKWIDESVEA
ncbi:MAG: divalent-cation tolerance protein CutA [Thermoprotei archaeon]|nr:MAG: divalent-cation tolerance protein CutA [Thermoprotei archaeon]RLF02053.1 MAG: divalent-cation tolerance protein CutA [Thermoprotei archaeon]